MMKFLRSQSQTVLIVVLGVIGFGFLFYGNAGTLLTNTASRAHNDFGRIDGEDISSSELYDAIRNQRDAFTIMGRSQVLNQPNARAIVAEEAWRQLLLLHEADKLHVQVSTKQVVDNIQAMQPFQKDGVYSPDLYQSSMTKLQNNLHISPDTFANIVSNGLRTDAVRAALFSSIHASAQDVAVKYEQYEGPVQVTIASFDPKTFVNSAQVTPDEIQTEYKSNQDNPTYRTKEKRKVDYVLFSLTPEQAKLPAKDKATAMEALGEKALNFALSLQPDPTATVANAPAADFVAGATKSGLKAATTDFFTADTTPAGVPPSPSFNSAAFSLTKEDPISKVVEMENGVAVLHLVDVQASEARPFDEVKADIVKTLQQRKGSQALQVAAQIAGQTLKDAVAKGSDFKTAASGLKMQLQTLPAFIPTKAPQSDQRLSTIAYVSVTLPVGGVSEPVPLQTDGSVLIVHLDSRSNADPAGLAQFESQYRQSQEEQLRGNAYADWAAWASKRPGTHKPPDLDQYGLTD